MAVKKKKKKKLTSSCLTYKRKIVLNIYTLILSKEARMKYNQNASCRQFGPYSFLTCIFFNEIFQQHCLSISPKSIDSEIESLSTVMANAAVTPSKIEIPAAIRLLWLKNCKPVQIGQGGRRVKCMGETVNSRQAVEKRYDMFKDAVTNGN